MKDLSAGKLALLFAGCFLGAGYVSGQEIWQYFGCFGRAGFAGLLLSMLLLLLLGVCILQISRMGKTTQADRICIGWDAPLLKTGMAFLEMTLMLAVSAIMMAGVGALSFQLCGVPAWLGSLIFCLIVLVCTFAGLQGMVAAFSFSVPLLAGVTVLLCVLTVCAGGAEIPAQISRQNSFLGSWGFSAVNYACYNVFVAVALLAPFGPFVKSRKTVWLGVGGGTLLLTMIALSVLVCLHSIPGAAEEEIPMLAAAAATVPGGQWVYAVLLLLAMFGATLSSLIGTAHFLKEKSAFCRRHDRAGLLVLAALSFAASLFGFGDLIGVLYPIFGYGSMLFLALMVGNYLILRRRKKS